MVSAYELFRTTRLTPPNNLRDAEMSLIGEDFDVKSKVFVASVAMLVSLFVSACVSTIENKENMLIAAGFRTRPVDTQDKADALRALPPHKFVMKTQDNNQVVYLYADPTICKCLYYGNQDAYQAYQQMAFQQRIADQKLIAATMMQDTQWNYWGAWGPDPWFY